MSLDNILAGSSISASGLAGERMRMEVAANNIANARSTRSVNGGPYRRQQVVFAAQMDRFLLPGNAGQPNLGGVRVVGTQADNSPLPQIYDPGHPDANADGYVLMPNVNLPHEMVDLVTASRAYEANLKSLESFRQLAEQALSLLRGIS
ncbi:MAG: flagellar basal body rod protein FlgC [Planctomycetaceae bacterium]